MNAAVLFDTVPAAMLRHRLALGVTCVDAIRRNGATGSLSTTLERIGAAPLRQAFDRHRDDRFALRYAGRIKQRIDKAVLDATPVSLHITVDAAARTYVSRRLQLTLVLQDDVPAPTPANTRALWVWPGAAYPFPATATLLRGSVNRGGGPVRWSRVFATTPATETDFALATIVGCAHGDERGEFVLALGSNAVSGAALVNPVQVRLWAFTAPVAPQDPPLEDAGVALDSAILRGAAVPPTYTEQQSMTVALRLGEAHGASFSFGP